MFYPNPARDKIFLDLPRAGFTARQITASIYNLAGELMLNSTFRDADHSLDIRRILSGIYFLVLEENGVKTSHNLAIIN
jgi:hypothetical protein